MGITAAMGIITCPKVSDIHHSSYGILTSTKVPDLCRGHQATRLLKSFFTYDSPGSEDEHGIAFVKTKA